MDFKNNTIYNSSFEKINNIRFYPYVGENYANGSKRILILAHNRYCTPELLEREQVRTSSRTHFADAIGEFTYQQGWWTKTFRNFIKGSLGITENYTMNSKPEVTSKINDFVKSISHTNYIDDLVPSDRAINISIDNELILRSHKINNEIYRVINATHIVCWGKNIFNYIIGQDEIKVVERTNNLNLTDGSSNKKGFEYAKIKLGDQEIHLLKVYHPSMPGFGHKQESTHKILEWFYKK